MTDLENAIQWLEYTEKASMIQEGIFYITKPTTSDFAVTAANCRALLDALKENAQLKAELAEYAEAFSEQNNALSDNIIANARLKAKLNAVRKWANKPIEIDDFGYQWAQESVLAIIDKDGDDK